MRTTLEITDAQRARLLEIAARRGEKGFSHLVQDALDRYLADEEHRNAQIEAALALAGTLDDKAAEALEGSVRQLRKTWR
jgi:predicted transcriptional regulator